MPFRVFLNQTIRNSLFILFYDYRTKKPTTTGGKLSPVEPPDEPAPDAAPSAHADFATGGGGGIESRRACDVVFDWARNLNSSKGV